MSSVYERDIKVYDMIDELKKGVYVRTDGGTYCNGLETKVSHTHIPPQYMAVMFNNMLNWIRMCDEDVDLYELLYVNECELEDVAYNGDWRVKDV